MRGVSCGCASDPMSRPDHAWPHATRATSEDDRGHPPINARRRRLLGALEAAKLDIANAHGRSEIGRRSRPWRFARRSSRPLRQLRAPGPLEAGRVSPRRCRAHTQFRCEGARRHPGDRDQLQRRGEGSSRVRYRAGSLGSLALALPAGRRLRGRATAHSWASRHRSLVRPLRPSRTGCAERAARGVSTAPAGRWLADAVYDVRRFSEVLTASPTRIATAHASK
jgi:hypothetical protein